MECKAKRCNFEMISLQKTIVSQFNQSLSQTLSFKGDVSVNLQFLQIKQYENLFIRLRLRTVRSLSLIDNKRLPV